MGRNATEEELFKIAEKRTMQSEDFFIVAECGRTKGYQEINKFLKWCALHGYKIKNKRKLPVKYVYEFCEIEYEIYKPEVFK